MSTMAFSLLILRLLDSICLDSIYWLQISLKQKVTIFPGHQCFMLKMDELQLQLMNPCHVLSNYN